MSSVCIYATRAAKAGVNPLGDASCAQAFAVATLPLGPKKSFASFSLPPGDYVLVARNEGRELQYTQSLSLQAGQAVKFMIPGGPTAAKASPFSVQSFLNFMLH